MSAKFEDLIVQHQSAERIPDDILFHWVSQVHIWESMVNTRKLEVDGEKIGVRRVAESPLGQEVRRRAKSDLFFLTRYFLWGTMPFGAGKDMVDNLIGETHRLMCNLFVKKDCSKKIAQQDWRKERMLLWPRGGMKSTTDVCDAVQWILNFPDIRICFLTAEDGLARGFTQETRGHFLIHPENELSWMNMFFPEYCVEPTKRESEYIFTCPLWEKKNVIRKEATVMAYSVGSNVSGPHFDVIKADDAVSNINSATEEYCKKTSAGIKLITKTLMPYGYLDYVGTRYADEDAYGEILEKNVGDIQRTETGNIETFDNKTTGLQILIGRAWKIKPEVQHDLDAGSKKYEDLESTDFDLLLPDYLSYNHLKKKLSDDGETIFEGQYNQNPRPRGKTIFDRPMLARHTVHFQKLPVSGPISITWDFAFSAAKGRDFSTASVCIWNDKAQMFVIDLIRSRFTPAKLAETVVNLAVKWRPFIVGIEKAGGSHLLEPSILAEAAKPGVPPEITAVCSRLDWITVDTQKEAKRIRMAALHPMLMNDQLFFAEHLPFLPTLYDEFERCLVSRAAHNDIPDVISLQPRYMPRMMQSIQTNEVATFSRSDAAYNLLYEPGTDAFGRIGMGWMTPPPSEIIIDDSVRAETTPGFDPILGAGIGG